jgi:hypothetical protein
MDHITHPTTFISRSDCAREDFYNLLLRKFLEKNPGITEGEFLSNSIAERRKSIEDIDGITDQDIVDHLKKIYPIQTKDKKRELLWLEFKLKEWKERISKWKQEHEFVISNLELRKSRLPQPIKETKSLLVEGKKLNLLDRFIIANQLIDLNGHIGKLNSTDESKYKILSAIFGCSPTNARQLVNGNYGAKPHPDLIEKFIASLN